MTGSKPYWDKYYKSASDLTTIPSQFAAFVASEFYLKAPRIFDLGAGNGRDSFFFSQIGFDVVAVDGSEATIALLKESPYLRVAESLDLGAPEVFERFVISQRSEVLNLFYGRFLLHALDDLTLINFFQSLSKVVKQGDYLAFEFRTREDDHLPKTTSKHFRRGLEVSKIVGDLAQLGFQCEYMREGFGFAKYGDDDAHVARLILKK